MKAASIQLPSKDAEFATLAKVHVFQAELGYRVAAEAKHIAVALKTLDSPLTGKATLKCKLQYANGDGPSNGYLSFGDSADESRLVKCGLRMRKKSAAIIQGPLAKDKGATAPYETNSTRQYELVVRVDLQSGDVTLQSGTATLTAKLERPMKSITHVGYCLSGTTTDFSPIECAEGQ